MVRNIMLFSVLLTLIGCASVHRIPEGSDKLVFDSSEWKRAKEYEPSDSIPSIRQQMLVDLVKNVLPGKTKEEIQILLGKSENNNIFPSIKRDFTYWTGWERGNYFGSIDSEWLLIILDASGTFKNFIILND